MAKAKGKAMLNGMVATVAGSINGSVGRRMKSKTIKATLFAALVATTLSLGIPAAFANSNAYPDGPTQTVVASPPINPGFAAAYQQTGQVVTPLSAATAVSNVGSKREPDFAGSQTTYGVTPPAVAHMSPAQTNS